MMMEGYEVILVLIGSYFCLIIISFLWSWIRAPGFNVQNKHVLITGGSAGLGLSIAKQYILAGANVSILARSLEKLEEAKKILEKINTFSNTKIFIGSCDICKYEEVENTIKQAIAFHKKPIFHLICNAGMSLPGYFHEQDLSYFKKSMDLNYFGALHTIKAAFPGMMKAQEGKIVFISSACSYIGFIGFSQYCPTKYAVRGLADSLRNELLLHNISVNIFYPGSMDTPGFKAENEIKPKETMEIEGSSSLASADDAAKSLINGIKNGKYAITNDVGVWMLRILGNGIAPRKNTFMELALLPFLVIIEKGFLCFIDYIVLKSRKRNINTKYKKE